MNNTLDLSSLQGNGMMRSRDKDKSVQKDKKKKTAIDTKNIKTIPPQTPKEQRRTDMRNPKNTKREPKKIDWSYEGYVGAPYNFVPIAKDTYDYEENEKRRPNHNEMKEQLLSGCISYTIEAKTPIIVDGGEKDSDNISTGEFYKDANGRYAIPGSSIRGLVRNNAQILSFSDVSEDIDDYELMYRSVASGAEKRRYNEILGTKPVPLGKDNSSISILKHVKAGYIEKIGEDYKIHPTKLETIKDEYGEMNYYVVNERIIIEDYRKYQEKSKFKYLFSSNFKHFMQYTEDCEFEEKKDKHGMKHYRPKNKKTMFNGIQDGKYRPYYQKVSYNVKEDRITAIDAVGKLENEGYILSSGAMNEKKAFYIIPKMDENQESIKINPKDVKSFQRDFESRKTQLVKGAEDFFNLPKEKNEIKPVFYIEYGGKWYFGFTPRLRLFYDYNVKKQFKENEQNLSKIDYCKAMFGTASNKGQYKTRLSFQDAYVDYAKAMRPVNKVLASPKPTSYLDYIEKENESKRKNFIVTYNDEDFQLRGIKQYWLKKEVEEKGGETGKNKNVGSVFSPLPKGTVFSGKVRFHNLQKDELGLLLWSIALNKESEQNIGKAKAYGFGRIKITIDKLELFDLEDAYNLNKFSFNPVREEMGESYIQDFKEEMKRWLKKEIEEMPNIQDFFSMKDSSKIPGNDQTRYMSIDDGEYQERVNKNYPLPTVKQVIEQSRSKKK